MHSYNTRNKDAYKAPQNQKQLVETSFAVSVF